MSSHKQKTIKTSSDPTGKTQINTSDKKRPELANGNTLLSFRRFNAKSIRVGDFNNFYVDHKSAVIALLEFHAVLKEISDISYNELFSRQYGKSLRAKKIRGDDDAIERIEKVLIDGYSVPKLMVEQFERSYIETAFGNGRRMISIYMDGILEPLFIDNNHLICRGSSRAVKVKELYSYPCLLDDIHLDDVTGLRECNIAELVMDDVMSGGYKDVEEIIRVYKELKDLNDG